MKGIYAAGMKYGKRKMGKQTISLAVNGLQCAILLPSGNVYGADFSPDPAVLAANFNRNPRLTCLHGYVGRTKKEPYAFDVRAAAFELGHRARQSDQNVNEFLAAIFVATPLDQSENALAKVDQTFALLYNSERFLADPERHLALAKSEFVDGKPISGPLLLALFDDLGVTIQQRLRFWIRKQEGIGVNDFMAGRVAPTMRQHFLDLFGLLSMTDLLSDIQHRRDSAWLCLCEGTGIEGRDLLHLLDQELMTTKIDLASVTISPVPDDNTMPVNELVVELITKKTGLVIA